jgi:hypothetical protein
MRGLVKVSVAGVIYIDTDWCMFENKYTNEPTTSGPYRLLDFIGKFP